MKKNDRPTAQAENVQKKFKVIPTPLQMRTITRNVYEEIIQAKLGDCKRHLMNDEFVEAHRDLQCIIHIYEPARVALYKMLAYELDGEELNLSILDPAREWDSNLLNPEITPSHLLVEDVLEALDEGMESFYNNDEAAQKATACAISLPLERSFIEILGGTNCEALLEQTAELLHKGEYDKVESLLKLAGEYDSVAANIFAAQLYDGIDRKEDFFKCIEMAASYGNVPCMFTLSACYRCGYGEEESEDYADAWYWMACQYDVDNRGLKEAILLNV